MKHYADNNCREVNYKERDWVLVHLRPHRYFRFQSTQQITLSLLRDTLVHIRYWNELGLLLISSNYPQKPEFIRCSTAPYLNPFIILKTLLSPHYRYQQRALIINQSLLLW